MFDYDFMESAVKNICDSLINNIDEWEFNKGTFKKKGTNINFIYDAFELTPITTVWNGTCFDQVFSKEQGERITKAYNIANKAISNKILLNKSQIQILKIYSRVNL